MLSRDPSIRPSALQCLEHEWFKNAEKQKQVEKVKSNNEILLSQDSGS